MTYMKTDFEKKLKELGFSYKCHTDDFYILCKDNEADSIIKAQLISSEPIDVLKHGSRNRNVIQSIGFFKLRIQAVVIESDYFVLAFPNTINHCGEFIIIPKIELMKRLNKENRISTDNQEIEMVFWLMTDNCLYDTTNISIEGEWYYMSKGVNGRMADGTDWNYSDFLNDWDRLKMI
jgi:hypothetical protein